MFNELNHLYIVIPIICILGAIMLILRSRLTKEPDKLTKAFKLLQLNVVITGAFFLALWLILPSTPSLGTAGYPGSVETIQSPERLLELLQAYNRALVRTTAVLHWFILVFVAWFLLSIYNLCKVVTEVIAERGRL